MVRFVRNPTVQWTELDSLTEDRESQYSKQMLKEMIERKRRNDFVRRREFDQLRKLRQREVLRHRTEDASNRPSFFQSSMASPRPTSAVTLKKIDEIEAQMSQQWWKSKQSGNEAGETMPLTMPLAQHSLHRGRTPRRPMPSICAHGAGYLGQPLEPPCCCAYGPQPRWRPLFANDSMAVGRFGGGRCAASGTRGTPSVQPHCARRVSPGCPAGEIRARTRS